MNTLITAWNAVILYILNRTLPMKPALIAAVLLALISTVFLSFTTFAKNRDTSTTAVANSTISANKNNNRTSSTVQENSNDRKKPNQPSTTQQNKKRVASNDSGATNPSTSIEEVKLIRKTVADYNKDISGAELLKHADATSNSNHTSPVRRINRNRNKLKNLLDKNYYFRSADGSDNSLIHAAMNATETQLIRIANADYSDGISAVAGVNRPNPRAISNAVHTQKISTQTYKLASDMLWQWGQFLDHDIDLTDGVEPAEPEPISVPTGDVFFDPNSTGTVKMSFNRSIYDEHTGINTPRQQINEITGWIDASNVYGSDEERALALRTLDGTGQLKTSNKNLLPFNTEGLSNAGGAAATLFLAGDVRANEQVGLTAMHTLFMREHNRLTKQIRRSNRNLNGDEIYQLARRIVGAQIQVITYNEFLPVLLGENALTPYRGYRPEVDATITNEFSTAAFRFGHSLLSPQILRLNNRGKETKHGHLDLRDAFFSPQRITTEGGIAPILRGLANQSCQNLDELIIDDVRNFLFGQPGRGGFDLVSLNIQRGRDHGLSSYNATRVAYGLPAITRFEDITSDPAKQEKLAATYRSVDDLDLWVAGLIEDNVTDALVGETFFAIIKDQFERLRDGDRFWYQKQFRGYSKKYIKKTTLAKIIRRNTRIGRELPNNVFLAP